LTRCAHPGLVLFGPAALRFDPHTDEAMSILLPANWIVKTAFEIHKKQKKIPLVLLLLLTFPGYGASKSKWRAASEGARRLLRAASLCDFTFVALCLLG
jgi:hypothetical protein